MTAKPNDNAIVGLKHALAAMFILSIAVLLSFVAVLTVYLIGS